MLQTHSTMNHRPWTPTVASGAEERGAEERPGTILKITVNNSHAPHRTQDLLRVVDWQPNACTHFFRFGIVRRRFSHHDDRENKNETAGMTKNKNMARLRSSLPPPLILRPPMLLYQIGDGYLCVGIAPLPELH